MAEWTQRALVTGATAHYVDLRFWDVLWYFNTYLGGVPKGSVIDTDDKTMELCGWRIEFRKVASQQKRLPEGPYDFTVPFRPELEPEHTYDHVIHDLRHLMQVVTGRPWEPMHAMECFDDGTENRARREKELGKKFRMGHARSTLRPPRRDQGDALPYEEAIRPVRRARGKVRRSEDRKDERGQEPR